MKRVVVVLLLTLAVAGYASAQVTGAYNGDVLGAHNIYGRGCVGCHAPHSGAAANGGLSSANSGNLALWGEDLVPLYGQTLVFGNSGHGTYSVSIPNYGTLTSYPNDPAAPAAGNTSPGTPVGLPSSASDGIFVIAACLSCHDGNVAVQGMMKGKTVETVTINGVAINPPTLLGNDGSTPGNYLNDHPVGPNANPGCGGSYNWDCTFNATGSGLVYNGTASSAFLTNYYDVTKAGPIANLAAPLPGVSGTYTSGTTTYTTSWVTCTTCHNQHVMNWFNTGAKTAAGAPIIRPTSFFVRGWYNPGNNTTSNNVAQFCRTCHGGESNEMNGQMSIPTN